MVLGFDTIDWLALHVVAPALQILPLGDKVGNPRDITVAGLLALLQIAIIALVFRPLENVLPAERWNDRRLVRIDVHYTLLMLLGVFPLFSFLVLTPVVALFGSGAAETHASGGFGLKHWLPGLDGHPWLAFGLYYVVYDFTYYWMHRAQHAIPWWWALHSMHHSQRQMSCWSNDRGSYLDGGLQSFILAGVGVLMGVDVDEFALMQLLSELVQNFSHANVRIGFGRQLERVFVDPPFHRLHHMRVNPARPGLHNCNFGQVLSIWDVLFRTARYGIGVLPTGVGDPVVDADNGRGIVAMQWGALRRFWGALWHVDGWRPGEVAFAADFTPRRVDPGDLHEYALEEGTATVVSGGT